MTATTAPTREWSDRAFRHEALLYSGAGEFVKGTASFIREAVAADEPILVVVGAPKIEMLREELGDTAAAVCFGDMAQIGLNPARIIPAWQEFVEEHAPTGRRFRGIGEPIWPERTPAELVESQRHELLLNVAFAGSPEWWLLCPYDVEALDASVIEEAHRSHPFVLEGSAHLESPAYDESRSPFEGGLPEPETVTETVPFGPGALATVRAVVARFATAHHLTSERVADFVVAANEVATNSLYHAGGRGVLCLWREGRTLLCEIRDDGSIDEPLVGRERPDTHQDGGRGLWLANQLCDLVQVRSSAGRTVVRLHVSL